MSLTNLLVVVLTVAAAARGDGNNVVFEDSLHNKAMTPDVKPTAVPEHQSIAVPDHRPTTTPTPSRPDKIVQTLILGLYNATLNLDRSLTSLNAHDHESDRNVIVSPACAAAALSLVLLGARGQTKKELGRLFGFDGLSNSTDDGDGKNFQGLGTLLNDYRDGGGGALGGARATLAKTIFVQSDYPPASQYRAAAKEIFNTLPITVDFKRNGLDAQQTINRWVSTHTHGKINEIIQNTPPPDTKLVIASALYFEGEWENPFFANYTKIKPFYYESNNSSAKKNKDPIYVPMMLGNSEVFYHKNDKLQFKAIGLPYKGDEYTAYFVLPDRNDSLRNLMSTMNERTLKQITESTTLVDITYFVPKMTLKSFTNLTPVYKNMGINSVFDPFKSDLSKMGLDSNSYVNDILHKVEIIVDEIGTVASAATVVTITRGGHPIFNVNRPFLFFIHHHQSDTILFWASVNKPTPYFKTPQISLKKNLSV